MADRLTLFRRAVPVVIGLVGLIFTIVGGWQLFSLTWDKATGTAEACRTQAVQAGTNTSKKRADWVCDVTWQAEGKSHTAAVTVDQDTYNGQAVELRVKGDSAVAPGPVWVGAGITGLGMILLVTGAVLFRRSRRHAGD